MNKKEIIELLTPWVAHHAAITVAYERLEAALSLHMENPIFEALWNGFDLYTSALGQLVGDADESWLNWYAHENGLGGKGLSAKSGDGHAMRPIRTLSDLARLILESRA